MNNQVNERVISHLEKAWLENARINSHNLNNYRKVGNMVVPHHKVAVICGAGASLSEHIEFFKANREALYVICVDVAYPVLYKNNLTPDLVITLDPTDLATCFLFKPAPTWVSLLAASVSHPNTVAAWNRPNSVYMFNLMDNDNAVFEQVVRYAPKLQPMLSKFNVGEFAVQFAVRYASFKNVIITGIDFAYYDDKYYADGIAHNVTPLKPEEETYLLDYRNQMVKSTISFQMFALAFMKNYRECYSQSAKIISLNKGILPLKYDLEGAINMIEERKVFINGTKLNEVANS